MEFKTTQLNIEGIYFWGSGIEKKLDIKFEKIIQNSCNELGLETGKRYGVVTVNNKVMDFYFHPAQIVIKTLGNESFHNKVVNTVKTDLENSDLSVKITLREY